MGRSPPKSTALCCRRGVGWGGHAARFVIGTSLFDECVNPCGPRDRLVENPFDVWRFAGVYERSDFSLDVSTSCFESVLCAAASAALLKTRPVNLTVREVARNAHLSNCDEAQTGIRKIPEEHGSYLLADRLLNPLGAVGHNQLSNVRLMDSIS